MLSKVGITIRLHTVDQATLINEVIAGSFQASFWRQHAGGDPDNQYIWWHGGDNPTNFARIQDAVIDKALDDGRVEPDPAKRQEIYERISKRFAEKVYDLWFSYSQWGIGLAPDVHGVVSVDLPDGGGHAFTGMAGGHPVYGMWISQN
jgi:peptide/nickel transport system substrate-binding protein